MSENTKHYVESVTLFLNHAKRNVDAAAVSAEPIKDAELTIHMEKIAKTVNDTVAYINSRTGERG